MMLYPLAIGGVCIVTSIIGTFFVKLGANQSIMGALYKGLIATGVLSLVGVAAVIYCAGRLRHRHDVAGVTFTGMALFRCGVVGLVVTGADRRGSPNTTPAPTTARCSRSPSVLGHRPRHQRDPGPRGLDGIDRAAGAGDHRAASSSPTPWPACSASPSRPPPCWRWPAWSWRSTPSARSPTMPAASPKWPACRRRSARPPTRSTRSATPPRRSPRAMRSARPASARWCCSRPTPRT